MYRKHMEMLDSIVQEFKKPDLFITFTTNPEWKEIMENLPENQTAHDRPDLVARVFELKKKELIADLYDRGVLGREVAHVHTVEFQKRGLPHLHLLIILSEQDALKNSDDFDAVTCAEIPNKATNPHLSERLPESVMQADAIEDADSQAPVQAQAQEERKLNAGKMEG